jgi:hypothetical protein
MTSIGEATTIGGGSNRLAVAPSRPCALEGCVAEVVMVGRHGETLGVTHLTAGEQGLLIGILGAINNEPQTRLGPPCTCERASDTGHDPSCPRAAWARGVGRG